MEGLFNDAHHKQRTVVGMGEPVTVEIDGQASVLILKDVYKKARKNFEFSEMPPDEAYAAVEQA